MRVISGHSRGRHLKAPRGTETRPTSDRVKEAVFNVIAGRIPGSRILDTFAGTGALGIEALSRGGTFAVFIEKSQTTWRVLTENLSSTGLMEVSAVYRGDSLTVLSRLKDCFDIVFLDPPYGRGMLQPAVNLILDKKLIGPGSLLIVETDARKRELVESPLITLVKESVYGDTAVLYFELLGGKSCGCN